MVIAMVVFMMMAGRLLTSKVIGWLCLVVRPTEFF